METKKNNAQILTNFEKRIVAHVDLNSFFAIAEQQANPYLRGKPVGIIKAVGRSCIIAASPEAKKNGVSTGTNAYDAKKLCPGIILVPADFEKYSDITYRFIGICKDYSPDCEVFSLDECFIDLTETEKFWSNAFNIAFEIKDRIRTQIGDYISCSIGISHNRFLAKLASSQIKPDGLFWITEDNALSVLDKAGLMDVCGLGYGLYKKLTSLNIINFAQLRALPIVFLQKHFGPFWSVHLYNLSRGIDNSSVNSFKSLPEQKSVSRTYTTHKPLSNKSEILRLVRNLCEEAAFKARRMNLAGRYIGFCLRTSKRSWSKPTEENNQNKVWYGHKTLKVYVDDGKKLFDLCRLIAKNWEVGEIIFCAVTLGMLTKNSYITKPLLEDETRKKKITNSIDRINEKYGEYTVFPAQLLGMPFIMPEVTGFLGDKAYQLRNFN